jgi:hypothetical protein
VTKPFRASGSVGLLAGAFDAAADEIVAVGDGTSIVSLRLQPRDERYPAGAKRDKKATLNEARRVRRAESIDGCPGPFASPPTLIERRR